MEEKINKNIKIALPCLICDKLVEVKSKYIQVVVCKECKNAILDLKENFENIKNEIDRIKLKQALNIKYD
jgi:hypothetical protein